VKKRIGLIVNPFAGAGGRLGWKGTDWPLPLRVLEQGAPLVAPERARRFTRALARLDPEITIVAPPGPMGSDNVEGLQVEEAPCVPPGKWPTTPDDTERCARRLTERGVDLLVFVGGDGTARIIADTIGTRTPVLGVPSGVKAYSAIYAATPEEAAGLAYDYLNGRAGLEERPVLDIDEDAYRRGRLTVKTYGTLLVPTGRGLVYSGKSPSMGEEEAKREIAEYFAHELYRDCTLYILGPGSTLEAIARAIGVEGKTPLGVDAVHNRRIIARDADARTLEELARRYERIVIVVSPIGGQGFILGRGNQQITPTLVRRAGPSSLLVVATPGKLARLPALRVDTGDPRLDEELRGYRRVLVGYNRYRMGRVV